MPRTEFFGEIAVRLGYVIPGQVETALAQQGRAKGNGQAHKLIGMILLEAGSLTNNQLIDVLREMERQRNGGVPACGPATPNGR